MSRAVEGRVNSDFLETTLPPWNVVVVTLAMGVALGVALRILVLRALGAAVDLGAMAVLGMNALLVYSHIIPKKKPLLWGFVTYCCKKVQFVHCPTQLEILSVLRRRVPQP